MRVLDVSQHHVTIVEAFLSKSAFHELEVPQLISITCLWFGQDSLVKHLLVDFQELLLGAINVDQSRNDIVLAALR